MKQLLFSACLMLGLSISASAQSARDEFPANYFGLGTGINATTGIIGVTYEHVFKDHIGAFVNLGVGGWGYKMGVGGRLYFRNVHSGAIGINFSHVTGAKGVQSDLSVIENGKSVTKSITYDAHPVDVLNISYLKFWRLGQKARFNIEAGYSVPLNGKSADNYTIKTPNVVLDETSENALRIVQPGGIILAIGFTFGF